MDFSSLVARWLSQATTLGYRHYQPSIERWTVSHGSWLPMMSALKIVSTLFKFNLNVSQIPLPFEGVLRLDRKDVMSICPSRNNIRSMVLAGDAWL